MEKTALCGAVVRSMINSIDKVEYIWISNTNVIDIFNILSGEVEIDQDGKFFIPQTGYGFTNNSALCVYTNGVRGELVINPGICTKYNWFELIPPPEGFPKITPRGIITDSIKLSEIVTFGEYLYDIISTNFQVDDEQIAGLWDLILRAWFPPSGIVEDVVTLLTALRDRNRQRLVPIEPNFTKCEELVTTLLEWRDETFVTITDTGELGFVRDRNSSVRIHRLLKKSENQAIIEYSPPLPHFEHFPNIVLYLHKIKKGDSTQIAILIKDIENGESRWILDTFEADNNMFTIVNYIWNGVSHYEKLFTKIGICIRPV